MGTVWKGRDTLTRAPVAVKLLHGSSRELVERFALPEHAGLERLARALGVIAAPG